MMRLLFIGLSPSSELEKALLSNGFTVEKVKRIPTRGSAFDLVAFFPRGVDHIEDTEELRALFPSAWIALVVDRRWVASTQTQNALLRCQPKNDVWVSDEWEGLFWLSVQRALQHQGLSTEVSRLQDECERLKTSFGDLSRTSDNLIKQLERDVGLATNIQRSLLPRFSPEIPGVSLAVKYLPAAGVGGDYYDIFEMGDRKRYGVLIADSKTHGMAAALLSVLIRVRIEEMKDRFPESHSFVDYLNREFQQWHREALSSLSLIYGILDRGSLTFRYTVAGPLKPILWRAGRPEPINVIKNPPLGGVTQYEFRESTLTLKPGDLLILHTDGLEQTMGSEKETGLDRITKVLSAQHLSPDPLEVQNELMALVDRQVERQPLQDDLTLIHLAVNERALYLAETK